jgi:thiol:disulfide interchange protein
MKYITTVNHERNGDKNEEEIHKVVNEFNKHKEKNQPIILFLYLSGCGPCNETKKYWHKLAEEIIHAHKNKEALIAEINENQSSKLKGLNTDMIKGYPHIVYIDKTNIEYDEPEGRNHALVKKWIEKMLSQVRGGGKKKSRKNKKTKRSMRKRRTRRQR